MKIMSKLISEKIIHENIHFATIMRPQLADEGLTFLTDDEKFHPSWSLEIPKRKSSTNTLSTHF